MFDTIAPLFSETHTYTHHWNILVHFFSRMFSHHSVTAEQQLRENMKQTHRFQAGAEDASSSSGCHLDPSSSAASYLHAAEPGCVSVIRLWRDKNVWESRMSAGTNKLDNITTVFDLMCLMSRLPEGSCVCPALHIWKTKILVWSDFPSCHCRNASASLSSAAFPAANLQH